MPTPHEHYAEADRQLTLIEELFLRFSKAQEDPKGHNDELMRLVQASANSVNEFTKQVTLQLSVVQIHATLATAHQ